jgi:hypothetical protein
MPLFGEARGMSASSHACRRFIEKAATRELLRQDGTWTVNDAEAMEFDCLRSMIRTCLKLGVGDAEILLRFDEPHRLNMRFPLPTKTSSAAKHSI